jgi:hypothetical protein
MAVQIQFRRDAAADWTSENPVLAAGELGYETDTGSFKIGDGATAWTGLDYVNPVQASIVDAKGDLIVGASDGVVARLAVGADGTVLTADSGESGGVKWVAPAGLNSFLLMGA